MRHVVVTGGAGFIGSHLVDRLLETGCAVSAIDNLARGRRANLSVAFGNPNFRLITGDLATDEGANAAFAAALEHGSIDMVWHMAANSDIPGGVEDPAVDLRDTFLTTYYTLKAMRQFRIPEIAFASTSAIYGSHDEAVAEHSGPLFPISNYGAMKLASEGIISAAVESFLDRAYIFRFPNVIGGRATHGVILDLLEKLQRSKSELEVLGDGSQQKPYLHVSELVSALLFIVANCRERINCLNIAACDDGATVRYIAETVIRVAAPDTPIRYTGGSRGWVGDVPKVRYSTEKLNRLGWRPALSSTEAVEKAVREIAAEALACKP